MGVWRALNLKILLSINIGMDLYFTQNFAILICSEGELLITIPRRIQRGTLMDFPTFQTFQGFKVYK